MFEILIGVFVGLLVGWNLPQPQWAKHISEKIKSFFDSKE